MFEQQAKLKEAEFEKVKLQIQAKFNENSEIMQKMSA